jgi:hypothetical protein
VTHLTKAICRRAGWDYAQVVVEQALSQSQNFRCKSRYLIGYGAYFSARADELADLTDMLSEKMEAWNAGRPIGLQFSRSSFEGWALGDELGEFIYLTHSAALMSHLVTEERGERLSVVLGYEEVPEHAAAISLFLCSLSVKSVCPTVSVRTGALQITYFNS